MKYNGSPLAANSGFSELGNPCEPGYSVYSGCTSDSGVGRVADSLAVPPAASRVPLVSSRLHKLNIDKARLPLVELALTPGAWRAQRCFLLS